MTIDTFWAEATFGCPPYVHPADQALLYGARLKTDADSYLHLALLPEPYSGDLHNADIFILQANPGFDGSEYAEQYGSEEFRNRLIRSIEQKFEETAFPHVYFDTCFNGHAGYRSWSARLRGIATDRILAKRIATLDLFPYHSRKFIHHGSLLQLPSVAAMKRYVHEELVPRARRGEILLIVGRAHRLWSFAPSDDDGQNIIIYSDWRVRRCLLRPNTPAGKAILRRLGD